MITKRNIPIRILPNRCGRDNSIENDIETIRMYLEVRGTSGLMSQFYIHNASATYSPIFIEEDKQFYTQLVNVLSEIGIR